MVWILVRKLSWTSEKNTWQNMPCTHCLLFNRSRSILRHIRDSNVGDFGGGCSYHCAVPATPILSRRETFHRIFKWKETEIVNNVISALRIWGRLGQITKDEHGTASISKRQLHQDFSIKYACLWQKEFFFNKQWNCNQWT